MRVIRVSLCATVLGLTGCDLCHPGAADKGAPRWYHFQVAGLNEIAATSPLNPEQLSVALTGAKYIRLDAARKFDGAGHWYLIAPPLNTFYVKPDEVKSFTPVPGPPSDFVVKAAP